MVWRVVSGALDATRGCRRVFALSSLVWEDDVRMTLAPEIKAIYAVSVAPILGLPTCAAQSETPPVPRQRTVCPDCSRGW